MITRQTLTGIARAIAELDAVKGDFPERGEEADAWLCSRANLVLLLTNRGYRFQGGGSRRIEKSPDGPPFRGQAAFKIGDDLFTYDVSALLRNGQFLCTQHKVTDITRNGVIVDEDKKVEFTYAFTSADAARDFARRTLNRRLAEVFASKSRI